MLMVQDLFPFLLVLLAVLCHISVEAEEFPKKWRKRRLQPPPPPPDAPEAPVNCSTAALIDDLPDLREGFIQGAPAIGNEVPLCGLLAPDVRAIWYAIEGNGLCFYGITCYTCSADFDAGLQVYAGSCPNNLECLVGGNEEQEVSWQSLNLQKHYLLLGGFGDAGRFTFSIQVGDECKSTDPPTEESTETPTTAPPTDPPTEESTETPTTAPPTDPPTEESTTDPPTDSPTTAPPSGAQHIAFSVLMLMAGSAFATRV